MSSSNVCPFCKSPRSVDPRAACPKCGRSASDPGPQADDWGEDDLGGGLDISRGGSMASGGGGPSAYAGGGLSLGDDEDPFADDAPQGSLELDLPSSHSANTPRSIPAASPSLAPAGAVPDLVIPAAKSQPAPSLPVPPRSDPSLPPAATRSNPSLSPASRGNASLPVPPQSEPSLPPAQGLPSMQPAPAPAPPPPPDPAAMIARYPTPPSKVWESPAYAVKVLLRQLELRQDLESLRKRRSPDVPLYERALRAYHPKTFTVGLALLCAGLTVATFVFFLPVILRFVRDPG